MSKKITDENGNTYVQKKPFYKKIWFIALVIFILLAAFGSSANKKTENNNTSKSSTTNTAASSSSSNSTKQSSQKWTQADFDALAKGDMMNKGAGGAKLDDLINQYGKPSSTSDSSVNGMDTKMATWTNTNGSFGSNVILSFIKSDDGSYLLYSTAATGLK
ncbi:phage immunity protein [Eupransor demetentiae]|uniref:DUF3862 domain-containing protein n=1 Tax=Eupransor demetentiae TaxID=3109584 RepID=A0ABM9N4R0_9LACO|nr:hypothetical protein R54876_GBNLAHCA_00722 [Lactobacillaceae bacterium LMG 33000]